MGFKDLAHEAVYATADGGEEHELAAAVFVGGEGALNSIELTAEFAEALEEFEFFAFVMGHGVGPPFALDDTYLGYGIYLVGVLFAAFSF